MSNEDYNMLDRISSAINAAMVAEDERRALLEDRDYWKGKCQDLLKQSLRETQSMAGLMLKAALDGVLTPREEKGGGR